MSPHSPHAVLDFALAVPPIGQPLASVNVSTRPLKDAKATHVTLLPLAVVELRLCCPFLIILIDILCPLSLEVALSVILTVVPLPSVATLPPIEDKVAKLCSLTLLEVTQVDLLQRSHLLVIFVNGYKTCTIWLPIQFRSVVDGAIFEVLDSVRIVPTEG